jgi:hypothetical protein
VAETVAGAIRRAGNPGRSGHALSIRPAATVTAISGRALVIQQGGNLVYAKDQAGHSSIKVTVDVYGKLVPGENRDAMDCLGKSLKKSAIHAQTERVRTSNIQEIKANL